MDLLLQFIVNGLLLGGVYALCSMSLAIIYKATQVFNFAVGQIMVVGMFLAWSLMEMGAPILISIPGAVLITIGVGWVIERVAMRPLIGKPLFTSIMATFALIFILQGLMLLVWRGTAVMYPMPLPGENLQIGPILMAKELVWIFAITMLSVGIVFLFFQRTRTGLAMRAAAEHQQLAQVRGIPVSWVFSVTWMLAAAVCALGGIFVAYRLGVTMEVSAVGLAAFPAVLLGGIESIPGALVGGLIIGLSISLTSGLINPVAATIAPFVILLLILLFKTEGLFGLKTIERI